MEQHEAQKLWREICQGAHAISQQRGSSKYLPGTQEEVGVQIHQREIRDGKTSLDYRNWLTEIRQATGMGLHHPKKAEGEFKSRYRKLCLTWPTVPSDQFLAAEWGTKRSTLSAIRSELRRGEGYVFEPFDGGWKIVKRPSPQPKLIDEKPVVAANGNGNGYIAGVAIADAQPPMWAVQMLAEQKRTNDLLEKLIVAFTAAWSS